MQRNSVLPFHTETTIFDVFKISDLTFDLAIVEIVVQSHFHTKYTSWLFHFFHSAPVGCMPLFPCSSWRVMPAASHLTAILLKTCVTLW